MPGLLAREAPLAFDLFVLVMLALLPVLALAIGLVRRGYARAHGVLMAASFVLFVAALVDFEWAARTMEDRPPLPALALTIHLCFAVPALALWTWQIARAGQSRSDPRRHARRGRLVFSLLVVTVGTGVWVYREMFG